MSANLTTTNNGHKLRVVSIREIMKYNPETLRAGLKTNLCVMFEDNVKIDMTFGEIIVSRYLFIVTEAVPGLKLVSDYYVGAHYVNGIYTSNTFNKMYEVMLRDIVTEYVKPVNSRAVLDDVFRIMFEVFNEIYNNVVYNVLDYVSSIDILDFLEIQMYPDLLEAMVAVYNDKTPESVNNTYKVLKDIMFRPELKDNILARGYVSGAFNANQLNQMLASRGYVTEITSEIFKYPIASSYVLGMTDLYDLTIESRSGGKALYLSNKAVQDSEYFARELQLVSTNVNKLVDGDCGTKNYMSWLVRDESYNGKSDLGNLVGTRYFDEELGAERIITKKDTHLIGKNIKLRTALSCVHPDPRAICTSCFGDLSYGVHKHSDIGHLCSTTVSQKLTQSILSTKHLVSSADSSGIALCAEGAKFFNIKNNTDYAFKANLINKVKTSYSMLVSQEDAFGLKDLSKGVNVYKLDPTRVSKIASITIKSVCNDVEEYAPIIIKDANKYGCFTYDFLAYVIETSYTLDNFNRLEIDLNEWTTTKPIITIPKLEYNFLALTKNIKAEFKYMKTDGGVNETPESLLQKLFDLVNTKLDVSVSVLSTIVYAHTIYGEDDYRLSRNSPNPQLMRTKGVMTNRSLGGGYAWEEVMSTILSPRSFDGNNNIDHPLDGLIRPQEVLRKRVKEIYG